MINPQSYGEAKEFFVQKVLAQAATENLQFSETEKYMLQWSETDPSFHLDQHLIEIFEKQINAKDYENKISQLIIHAYNNDMRMNITAKDKYRKAYDALKTHDNYIFIMVDQAIGRHFNKLGLFFGAYPSGREYIFRVFFAGMLSFLLLCYVILTLHREKPISITNFREVLPQLIFSIIFASATFSNIKKYRRYIKEKF